MLSFAVYHHHSAEPLQQRQLRLTLAAAPALEHWPATQHHSSQSRTISNTITVPDEGDRRVEYVFCPNIIITTAVFSFVSPTQPIRQLLKPYAPRAVHDCGTTTELISHKKKERKRHCVSLCVAVGEALQKFRNHMRFRQVVRSSWSSGPPLPLCGCTTLVLSAGAGTFDHCHHRISHTNLKICQGIKQI